VALAGWKGNELIDLREKGHKFGLHGVAEDGDACGWLVGADEINDWHGAEQVAQAAPTQ
jgi:hypothetical protein